MLKQSLVAAVVLLWAGTAIAQPTVGVEKDTLGGTTFTSSDIQEIQKFKQEHKVEQEIILLTCKEYVFKARDQVVWNQRYAQAVMACAVRGEQEYVRNYRFVSPYLAGAFRNNWTF